MAKMYKLILVLCLSFFSVFAKNEIYDGHTLYNVVVKDLEEAKLVNSLENEMPLDIWNYATPGRVGHVLVSKDEKQLFEDKLQSAGVEYTVEVENIKESIEEEERWLATATRRSNRSSIGLPFDTIHRYEEVDAYLVELAERFPETVTVVSAGESIEGRDIKYLKISTTNFEDESKPIVMLTSLLHSREWVTLPATLYAIEKLVIDVTESDLVENIDWIILPIANPDGYEWSHTNARFWRKNRARGFMAGDICMGVDLNRNFDFGWSTASSSNVCTETFHGLSPFSEPETAAIRDVVNEHKDRLELFIDVHSFGSMILYGFGNGQLPPNGLFLHVVGVSMAQAIDRVKWASKPNYRVGNIVAILYLASGGSSDWVQQYGAEYSFTYELPAFRNIQGSVNGFLVDPDFIEQAGFETWEGIKTGARDVLAMYRKRKNLLR